MAVLGYNTIGGTDTGAASDLNCWGSRFTATEAGLATKLWAYVKSTGTAEMRGAIYSASGNDPVNLLAQSSAANTNLTTSFQWLDVPISYTFANGETMFFSIKANDFLLTKYDADRGSDRVYLGNNIAYPDWDDPEASVSFNDAFVFSIYIEYTPLSGTKKLSLLGVG